MSGDDVEDELIRRVISPIRKNFPRLVRDCDPSKVIDKLYSLDAIDEDDMDRLIAKQTQEGRSVAANVLFLRLIQKAKAMQSMEIVNSLISALEESGFPELAELVEVKKREVAYGSETTDYDEPDAGSPVEAMGRQEVLGHQNQAFQQQNPGLRHPTPVTARDSMPVQETDQGSSWSHPVLHGRTYGLQAARPFLSTIPTATAAPAATEAPAATAAPAPTRALGSAQAEEMTSPPRRPGHLHSGDPVLRDLSVFFIDHTMTDQLAAYLLENISPYGPAFIQLTKRADVPWPDVALAVLIKWCNADQEPTGQKLLNVLAKMRQTALVRHFQDKLP